MGYRSDMDSATGLVDTMIGSAYPNVKIVAVNMEYVKHVSYHIEHIIGIEDDLVDINAVATNIDAIVNTSNHMDDILVINGNMDSIDIVGNDIDEVKEVADNIPELYEAVDTIITKTEEADALLTEAEILVNAASGIASPLIIADNLFGTKGSVEIWNPTVAPDYIRIAGHYAAGDGGAALYKKVASQPAHGGKIQSANGTWWEIAEEELRPIMFGVVGTGDELLKLQAMFDVAGLKGASIIDDDASKVYTTSATLRVKAGTKSVVMRSTLKGTGATINGILHLDGTTVYAASQLDDCLITVNIDMSGGDGDFIGLHCDGNDRCRIEGCRIFGSKNAPGAIDTPANNRRAISLSNGASHNHISGNDISLQSVPIPRHIGIDLTAAGQVDAGGFFEDPPFVGPASDPNIGNVITGNKINGGSYAINCQGAQKTVISGNYIRDQNHRSVYLGNCSMYNTITGNHFEEYASAAVLIGYHSQFNTVSANHCVTTSHGEACMNIILGARYNSIVGNTIDSATSYGVYIATNAVGNCILGNDIRNTYHAHIIIEANWTDNPPASATLARPNWGATLPEHRDSWAYGDCTDNVIKDNVIHHGWPGRSTGGIVLYSYIGDGDPALADWGIRNTIIEGNIITSTTNIGTDIHMYEQTAGKISGIRLRNNSFASDAGVRAVLAPLSAFFRLNDNALVISDNQVETLTVNSVTPSVATRRANYKTANTAPTSITHFTGGLEGQTIEIRLDSNSTLVHNTSFIRLKGSVNLVGTSNMFITFRCLSNIWFELWRNDTVAHPPINSPTFTGTVGVPNITPGTVSNTAAANTSFVQSAILAAKIDSTPGVDPPSVALGACSAIFTQSVTGAALGDPVVASFSLDLAGLAIVAWVSAANIVSYYFRNDLGANPTNIAAGTLKIRVLK